jgi:transposase
VEAAKEAFGVSRSTIYRWRRIYKDPGYNPLSLRLLLKRPKNLRKEMRIIKWIKERKS